MKSSAFFSNFSFVANGGYPLPSLCSTSKPRRPLNALKLAVMGVLCWPIVGGAALFTEHILVTEEQIIGGVRQSVVVFGKDGTNGTIVSTAAQKAAAVFSVDEPGSGAAEPTLHFQVGSNLGRTTNPDSFQRANKGFDNRAVFLTEPTVCPPTCPPEPATEASVIFSDIVQVTHNADPRAVGFDFFTLDFLSDPNSGIGQRGLFDPPNIVETGGLQEITAALLDDVVDPVTGQIVRHGYTAGFEPFRVYIQSCSIPCLVPEPNSSSLFLVAMLCLAATSKRKRLFQFHP